MAKWSNTYLDDGTRLPHPVQNGNRKTFIDFAGPQAYRYEGVLRETDISSVIRDIDYGTGPGFVDYSNLYEFEDGTPFVHVVPREWGKASNKAASLEVVDCCGVYITEVHTDGREEPNGVPAFEPDEIVAVPLEHIRGFAIEAVDSDVTHLDSSVDNTAPEFKDASVQIEECVACGDVSDDMIEEGGDRYCSLQCLNRRYENV